MHPWECRSQEPEIRRKKLYENQESISKARFLG